MAPEAPTVDPSTTVAADGSSGEKRLGVAETTQRILDHISRPKPKKPKMSMKTRRKKRRLEAEAEEGNGKGKGGKKKMKRKRKAEAAAALAPKPKVKPNYPPIIKYKYEKIRFQCYYNKLRRRLRPRRPPRRSVEIPSVEMASS